MKYKIGAPINMGKLRAARVVRKRGKERMENKKKRS
jgi:hypothetical protein